MQFQAWKPSGIAEYSIDSVNRQLCGESHFKPLIRVDRLKL
jgi:hypothetical protein